MNNPETVLWHKSAIIYQLHVRAYCDSNGDGIGDFPGLTSKLGYLKDLGINTLWLLPFYPSPLRDDGYDISDYCNIHPDYGTLADFRVFLRESRKLGLNVITELVINHTSDQHPWFQSARNASVDSITRNYYVWSDTSKKYEGTRIIFTDTEKSNWTWDATAKAYYWHRFFSHQPDLNFANPHVIKAIVHAMRFWFDMGVNGMRLDAIPYLCERENTSNENLPETHAVIRFLRAEMDKHFHNKIFLAEANQWPEDVSEYFGNGDECHMAFHFPLMPRIFMAVAQEDRHPIIDILTQTPEIPPNCQWANFLRNHDELTLEMVTHRERDYMYNIYAVDQRARINVGIRRRLAPLMEGDRSKIELLNSLLLSMPGSPVLYYGDEIGMGDNIYLGDRNGVRTPMQWSPDRNGGFSRADPQRLYLPPIMDAVYGYEAVNVEAQSRNTSSLLNWMRRLIATYKSQIAFGHGTLRFLHPGNRKILAYLREFEMESVLCVVNLACSAQPVELDLAAYKGRVPIELLGRTAFPAIGELPYLLTLPAYGFYWFRLSTDAAPPAWHVDKLPREELPVLVMPLGLVNTLQASPSGDSKNALLRKTRLQLESEVLPAYLSAQRWFHAIEKPITALQLEVGTEWTSSDGAQWLPLLINVAHRPDDVQCYFLPLGMLFEDAADQHYHNLSPWLLAKVRQRASMGILYDALGDNVFCQFLLNEFVNEKRLPFPGGDVVFFRTSAFPVLMDTHTVLHPALDQNNTSVIYGQQLILKVHRRIREGIDPEMEMGQFLSETSPCSSVAPLAGGITQHIDGRCRSIAVLHHYVINQGNGWQNTQDYLDRFFHRCVNEPVQARDPGKHALYQVQMYRLGQRTAELHRALALHSGNSAFDPEPLAVDDINVLINQCRETLISQFFLLKQRIPSLPEPTRHMCEELLGSESQLLSLLVPFLHEGPPLFKSRIHGHYQLGQLLCAKTDFFIINFAGDPERPDDLRRAKQSPLRDIADMTYSLYSAAFLALHRHLEERPEQRKLLEFGARDWALTAVDSFLTSYRRAIAGCPTHPTSLAQEQGLLTLYLVENALALLRTNLAVPQETLEVAARLLLDVAERRP